MRFKLDENFGSRTQQIFQVLGHDVQTVRSQGLRGSPDPHLYELCCSEGRCLVTLDLDFSDVTRFPPDKASGVVVVRVPVSPSLELLERLVRQFLQAISDISPEGKLWIVEIGRIRVYQPETDE